MGNWSRSINEHGEYDYDWSQDEADAVVYQHEGKWKLSYSMGYDEEWQQQDLPNATSSDSAIKQADPILWTKFYDHIEKDQSVKQEPLNAWTSTPRGNGVEYQRQVSTDVHAVTWQRSDGAWLLHVNDGTQLGFREHVIVDEPDVEKALGHADALIANPHYRPPQFLGLAGAEMDDQFEAMKAARTQELVDAFKNGLLQIADADDLYDLLGGRIEAVSTHGSPSGPYLAHRSMAPDPDCEVCEEVDVRPDNLADLVAGYERELAQKPIQIGTEDLRNIVDLANEIQNRTPAEQASLDRLKQSLDQTLGSGPGWSR